MDIRVAAYGVIIEGDNILLAHWNERGHDGWTLPGGGIDPGEDPSDAAVREIFEETGYEAELDGLIGIDSYVVPATRRLDPAAQGPLHAIRILYRAHVTGGDLTFEEDGSTDYAAWHPLSALPTLKRVGLVDVAMRMLDETL
ncbi:NUDIX hydrolase [Okibacterium fritillariae]|uniref:ADP-ribose pyrophosphatase YjhB, NUDIX family n=1 Tax=Okibacterium fritillariae TaxID=123320 RepID=A0A1T5I831_9MICO|nr:NUDIX hydrolase [Okibacterium fritillariae]SKC35341.1 ADP-ribose pyrophosphatase YjhB, NUDIX family [Okibacterium fritillariae]